MTTTASQAATDASVSASAVAVTTSSPPTAPPPKALTEDGEPKSSTAMQHAGSWLLLGLLDRYGVARLADQVCAKHDLSSPSVRLALDAFAIALAIGQGLRKNNRGLVLRQP